MTQNPTETPQVEVTRTELVWPGKYNPDGTLKEPQRVNLPFQVIERVNETRATREARKGPQELSLFDMWEGDEGDTFDDGWRNKLIWGDNLLVMSSLLQKFAGKVDLIYIDPPFATGADFTFDATVGEGDLEVAKEHSLIEEKAYRDTWGQGTSSYLQMMRDRLATMRDLLAPAGSIYVHLDATVGHYVKLILDEVFGPSSFQREIVWRIGWISGYKSAAKNWIRNHDTILYYVKTPGDFTFNKEYVPYPDGYTRRGGEKPTGKGYPIEDVWNANPFEFELTGSDSLDSIQIKSFSGEKTGYPTQKNESLLARIITASSNPGDLVADFFVGSGTTAAVAEKLNRRWIGCDLSRWAAHIARKRLLEIRDAQPFEILNLGQYERQYWQSVTFGDDRAAEEQTLYEYLAFILRLYGAEPVSGLVHLHGKRGKAMVHIGSVDAPVTFDEVMDAVRECKELGQSELHILGWEWEMGVNHLMVDEAKKLDVTLVALQIPREVMEQQAVDKGDIQFFELAHLEVSVKVAGREVNVQLDDFVIPNTELIPDDVREKVQKWSDYIDYWAVDWNFQDDTFMQGWVSYRTRQDRKLELVSDTHEYEEAGRYTVVVKVIDIFGNDTSQAYEIEVE